MARELVTLCDPCSDEGRRSEGQTRRLDLGFGLYEVETCDEHWAALTGRLEQLLNEHGRSVDLTTGPKKLRCPWCPQPLATPKNLRDHIDTKHPEQAAAFLEGLIPRKPRAVETRPAPSSGEQDYICDEASEDGGICGHECASPQGLGAHKRFVHHIEGTSQASRYNRRKTAS